MATATFTPATQTATATSPYEKGYTAQTLGVELEMNPYTPGTEAHEDWAYGWDLAHDEHLLLSGQSIW